MLIFDQLKKNDPYLRVIAIFVLGGLSLLLAGLWWVQVVSARDYQETLETQSFRTVRIPAVRGKIVDRNGIVLAEDQPTYNVSLYLEELRAQFQAEYARMRPVSTVTNARAWWQRWLGVRELTVKRAKLTRSQIEELKRLSRYVVASNVVRQVGLRLHQTLSLDAANFERHYETRLALPYPVLTNLGPAQIALFEEQSTSPIGVDLEVQSTRVYPYGTTAAHVLGHLQRDDSSMEGEEAFFSFRMPDYRGVVGVEYGFDKALRGMAGAESVLVNNVGYRQTENVWIPAEPGSNVVLTIDLGIQQAAERALQAVGPGTRGAAVVLDARNGDILAMASCPAFDPNAFVPRLSLAEWQRILAVQAEKNRATGENYAAGSIFKPIVGLACLEAGLNPNATMYNPGYYYVGRRPFHDLAPPGIYDFRKALMASCNTYFISNGLHVAGIANIVRMGRSFGLGEMTGLRTRQEVPGIFPSLQEVSSDWHDGDTANLCIGQGRMAVTPIQMAVMTAAIANGGKVLRPRLVDRIEPPDPALGGETNYLPKVEVRDDLDASARNLQIVRDAMLADVEDPHGTGTRAAVPGLRICGKTGTADVKNAAGASKITWFVSFAPYESPRYAVVVMVEGGSFGGITCAPAARTIYLALQDRERRANGSAQTLARMH